MSLRSLTILTLTCITLAACQPQPATPAAAPAAPAAAPVASTPAPATSGPAGVYTGVIPCADCPGIEATLTFMADGRYTQLMQYQERDSYFSNQGQWTREADGRIRLQPEDKNERTSWLQLLSPTAVRMMDSEGKPIESELNYTLTRKPD